MVNAFKALSAAALLVRSAMAAPKPQTGGLVTVDLPLGINVGVGVGPAPPPALPLNEIAPSNTGSAALPTPTGPPKHILMGIGFQNYTCNGAAFVSNEFGDGAIANLYDITSQVTQGDIDTLTPAALQSFETCLSATGCQPDGVTFCESCHIAAIASVDVLATRQVGLHFFNHPFGTQIPNFDLFAFGDFLSAKKVGDVKAPPGSYAGASGRGAVDWLYLVNSGNGLSHGDVSRVYRVETAGGVASKTCSTSGENLSVPYTAQYWFYT